MNESLEATKKRIAGSYLGRAGIHGVGIRRSQNAVSVYVDPRQASLERAQQVLAELKEAAAPYEVVVFEEEAPTILPSSFASPAPTAPPDDADKNN